MIATRAKSASCSAPQASASRSQARENHGRCPRRSQARNRRWISGAYGPHKGTQYFRDSVPGERNMNLNRLAKIAGVTALAAAAAFGLCRPPPGAAEDPVVIPAPAVDLTATGDSATADLCRRLFLGRAGRLPACEGRHQRRFGLCRRPRRRSHLRDGRHRPDRPCRNRRDHLRSQRDQLRPAAADLFLGRAQPDPAQLSRGRTTARSTARPSSSSPTRKSRSPRPISLSSTPPRCSPRRSSPRSKRSTLLSRRTVSSGLSDAEPDLPVHRLQRSAQGRSAQGTCSRPNIRRSRSSSARCEASHPFRMRN